MDSGHCPLDSLQIVEWIVYDFNNYCLLRCFQVMLYSSFKTRSGREMLPTFRYKMGPTRPTRPTGYSWSVLITLGQSWPPFASLGRLGQSWSLWGRFLKLHKLVVSELIDKVTLKFNEQTTCVEAPGYHLIRGPNAAGLFSVIMRIFNYSTICTAGLFSNYAQLKSISSCPIYYLSRSMNNLQVKTS